MSRNFSRTVETPKGYKDMPTGRQISYDKTYIGKVKDNRDIRHMGRLQVWIPELSKGENDPSGWILVSYCSPFAGATSVNSHENIKSGNENTYDATQHSYGFWAIPPDLNVGVLVMFANGDPAKGFWVGCIYDDQMNFSVPEISSDDGTNPKTEYNRKVPGLGMKQNPTRPVHTPMKEALKRQGLDKDTRRGLSNSSARRTGDFGSDTSPVSNNRTTHADMPSKVYGFKSPEGQSIVLDDDNHFIRFRTKNGAQILIDDENALIYFIGKDGNTWLELEDNGGNIDVYSRTNISLHAEGGNVNVKAGNDINFQAGNDINMKAAGFLKIDTGKDINMISAANIKKSAVNIESKGSGKIIETAPFIYMNSDSNPASDPIKPTARSVMGNSTFENGTWKSGKAYSDNIVSRVPQHEPWIMHTITTPFPTVKRSTERTPIYVDETGRTHSENVPPSIDKNSTTGSHEGNTPFPDKGIGTLNQTETKAYLDTLGFRESTNDYGKENSYGYLGKYQMGTAALEDTGYIKAGTYEKFQEGYANQSALDDPNNWTGKNGIYSKEDYLASQNAQEDAIMTFTNANYRGLTRKGVVNPNTPSNEVAGYLAAAHLSGVGGATALSKGIQRSDAYGTSTAEYFNLGAASINGISS